MPGTIWEEAGVADTGGVSDEDRRAAWRLGQRLDEQLRRAAYQGRPALGPRGGVWIGQKPDTAARKGSAASSVPASPARSRPAGVAGMLVHDSFQPWKSRLDRLVLAGAHGFEELRFDARCPTGVRGTPPHLDVLAVRPGGLVAVSAKGGSYLVHREKGLVEAYTTLPAMPGLEPWQELAAELARRPDLFHFVDVANLVKLALGLGATFRGFAMKLLYLYFEPPFASINPCFALHRTELARVVAGVEGSAVTLVTQTYAELWDEWEASSEAGWLRNMVAGLRQRYDVTLPPEKGL